MGASVVVLLFALNRLASSQVFALHHVVVKGADADLQPEVERTVKQTVGGARILSVDLEAIRQKIETIPRVRTAWVMRSLPDTIRVEVAERQPTVLVLRQSGNLEWLDAEGAELGDTSSVKISGGLPPPVRGFSEGNRTPAAVADDKDRIALYKKLQEQFTQSQDGIWDRLQEIDLTFPKDVTIRLIRPAILIRLGNQDFQNRAEQALKVLAAIQNGNLEMLGRFGMKNVQQFIDNPESLASIDISRGNSLVLIPAHPPVKTSDRQEPSKAPGKSK